MENLLPMNARVISEGSCKIVVQRFNVGVRRSANFQVAYVPARHSGKHTVTLSPSDSSSIVLLTTEDGERVGVRGARLILSSVFHRLNPNPSPCPLPIRWVEGNREDRGDHSSRHESILRHCSARWRLPLVWLLWTVLAMGAVIPVGAEQTNKTKKAELKISGYGWFGNRALKRIIRTVELGKSRPEFFGPVFVEDAALIITSRVKRDGYLVPQITVALDLEDGSHLRVPAQDLLEDPLPRPLRIRKAEFKIRKGVLYHYKELTFEGLETIPEKQARAYFVQTGTLLRLKRNRIFTPQNLERSLANLTEVLERDGYQQAKANLLDLDREDKTGAVRVHIGLQQGPKTVVRSVRQEFYFGTAATPAEVRMAHPGHPYSKVWAQDFAHAIKTNYYHRGYPDTAVELRPLQQSQSNGVVQVDLLATVKTGMQVNLLDISFVGQEKTRESVMQRRVRLKEGGLLDRINAEEGRHRLARLGVFETVDLEYQPVDGDTRSVLYRVEEGKQLDVNVLFGYGSYELLRGGFEVEQFNIWGRAHHARLKAVQSFKASTAEFIYTIPELVGRDIDIFLNASGLQREEVDFDRREYGGGLGAHKYFPSYSTDVGLRYSYQILKAIDTGGVAAEGLTNSSVGAFIFDIKHDRRDNPLYPRKGHKVFGSLELASEHLAGDVNYQRIDLSTSWHQPLGGGRLISIGISHGAALSIGSATEDLPFNKRFFPGGENSIRGYQEGEASPRNVEGDFIGAETYSLATVEFEQALTPTWSVVVFSDSLGFAQHAGDYPFDTGLFAVGGGLRWKTLIGPIRVEYGYNLNRRDGDPSGTLHFSLGFPF
jgi:outer membrane protein insertion porin family